MRIMISSPPPWAPSGYGIQAGLAAEALARLGHDVAISAYAGCYEEQPWHGIPILSTGGKAYGDGVIAGNYARWAADLVLFVCDPWLIDPRQLAGLHVAAWMPLDCEPLSSQNSWWLSQVRSSAASVRPVAMSKFGKMSLGFAKWDVPVVPHAASPSFYPDTDHGLAWRKSLNLPASAFVITKVGVNDDDDRKSFEVTLQAFAEHLRTSKNSALYLHCESQAKRAPNLAMMAVRLGLQGKVAFADPHRRAADQYSADDMRAIYCGSDVLDATSKGEGFGVPSVEALACGTPVIAARNSSMIEKIRPEHGWLVHGQHTWARHHNAWWVQPSVDDLARAYQKARTSSRSMRKAAAAAGAAYSVQAMQAAWEAALALPLPWHKDDQETADE